MRNICGGNILRVASLLALVGASGCSLETERTDFGEGNPVSQVRPDSDLVFQDCGEELECSVVEVPLDRNDPDGETIEIAINRMRADPGLEYGGVLFVNPGGPGGSGLDFVANSAADLSRVFAGFDIVGFDPRGVGKSTPLECEAQGNILESYQSGGSSEVVDLLRTASASCQTSAGDYRHHLGSNEVVEDIDHIREALGHSRINFFGISYGTRLGALYAQTFPTRIRALILDAPVSPVSDIVELNSGQFDARLTAHDALFDACDDGTLDCGSNPRDSYESILQGAIDDGELEEFANVWTSLLSSLEGRDFIASLLRDGLEEMPSEGMDDAMESTPPSPEGAGISAALNISVLCTDNAIEPPNEEEQDALLASFVERSETFASVGLSSLACSGWEVDSDPVPDIDFEPEFPALVLGGLQDFTTPVSWATDMSEALDGSVLMLSEHYGHSAVFLGSACVVTAIREYVLYLRLPDAGLTCPAREVAAP